MGALLGLHERSIIGGNIDLASGAASTRTEVFANPQGRGPARFLVICDESTYLRQGDDTVVATSGDMRLPADSSMVITVEKDNESYLAALQVSDAGTVKITRLDSVE